AGRASLPARITTSSPGQAQRRDVAVATAQSHRAWPGTPAPCFDPTEQEPCAGSADSRARTTLTATAVRWRWRATAATSAGSGATKRAAQAWIQRGARNPGVARDPYGGRLRLRHPACADAGGAPARVAGPLDPDAL